MAQTVLWRILGRWIALASLTTVANGVAPVFSNLNGVVNVGENEDSNRLLFTVSVEDYDKDPYTCSNNITGTGAINNDEFTFTLNVESQEYEFDVGPPTTLPYDKTITFYNIIECGDATQTSTATLTVNVIPGQDIWWNTLPATISKPAMSTGQNQVITRARASNTLDNPMTYHLHKVTPDLPHGPYFQVDPSTGNVTTIAHLKTIARDYPTVYIYVRATDGQLNLTERITLQLYEQNTRCTFVNFPATMSLSESTAAGTLLFTTTTNDPDSGQTISVDVDCDPSLIEDTFIHDNNNRFKINDGKSLNYEGVKKINCTFRCNDGIHDSDPYTFVLTVEDDNDAPKFSQPMYYATFTEGAAGSVSIDPQFTCTDEDSDNGIEPLDYSFQAVNRSDLFSVNSDGLISFAVNYDIDPPSDHPKLVYLTVYCCDDGDVINEKLCATAQVTITVNDDNDNAPDFASKTYQFYADNSMTPGSTILGIMSPNDIDTGSNSDWTCSGTSGDGNSVHYGVEGDCKVRLLTTPTMAYGTSVTYTATAVDHGSPEQTATATLHVVWVEASTTTTTTTVATTTEYNIWSNAGFITLFTLAMLLSLALLGLALYFCLRCCGICGGGGGGNFCDCYGRDNCCRRRYPPRQVTPVTPPREKTPRVREKTPPPRVVQPRPQRVNVIQTIARPPMGYGAWRPVPAGPQLIRSAPSLMPGPPAYRP